MPIVFISHASADREKVKREIVDLLESHRIRTWYSVENIQTAAEWERAILRGLEQCDWFLLVMSRQSSASDWVKDEVHWAMENRKGRIIPVLIEDCDPKAFHIRLPRLQHVDFRGDPKDAARRLLGVLREDADIDLGDSPSLAQAVAVMPGRCPQCGTVNEADRKFCRFCGSKLLEPCLNCDAENGVWVTYCGQCGANIPEDLASWIANAQAIQDSWRKMLKEFRHAELIDALEALCDPRHSALVEYGQWAKNCQTATRDDFDRQKQKTDRKVELASLEIRRRNDDRALSILQSIPAPFRTPQVDELLREIEEIRRAETISKKALEHAKPRSSA